MAEKLKQKTYDFDNIFDAVEFYEKARDRGEFPILLDNQQPILVCTEEKE